MTSVGGPGVGVVVHSLRLDAVGEAPEVAILSTDRTPAGGIRISLAWSHRFGTATAARICMDWMAERPCRWSRWSEAAALLGAPFATGVIEGEMAGGGAIERAPPAWHGSIRATDAAVIDCGFVRVRLALAAASPRLVAERRRRPFVNLTFPSEEQALRVWDWLRWQGWMLPDLYLLQRRGGPELVASLIFDLMIADERRAGNAPEGGKRDRPLRDWRP